MKNKKYISTREASQKYFYDRETFIDWIKRKHIKAFKQSNKWWIDKKTLENYIKAIES